MHAFVAVRMPGYVQEQEEIDLLGTGALTRNYRMRIGLGCVEGYVLNTKDRPVAGALAVAAVGRPGTTIDSWFFSPIVMATDAAGKYVIRGVPIGGIEVFAHSRLNIPADQWVDVEAGDCARADFHLDAAVEIRFRVFNKRGEAIPNAFVRGTRTGGDCDEQGEVRFPVPVTMGRFDVQVGAPGYRTKTVSLDPAAELPSVVLEDGPVLRGRVTSDADEPIAGARVEVDSEPVVVTDNSGKFSLRIASDQPSAITVSKIGFLERRLEFGGGRPAFPDEGTIRLRPVEGGVYGRVLDENGAPVTRFRIRLDRSAEESRYESFDRDFESDAGRFSIVDVPAGSYKLVISTLPYFDGESIRVTTAGSIEIRKGSFYGEVVLQFPPLKPAK